MINFLRVPPVEPQPGFMQQYSFIIMIGLMVLVLWLFMWRPEAKRRKQMQAFRDGLKKGDKSKYVLQAMDYIGAHYGEQTISVSTIAQHLGLSESHLSHLFRKETDYTLLNYLTRYRIHKAMELLRDCRTKVYEVAERVGYRDITYFSATFKKVTGMSPSEFQDTCR